MCEGKIGTPGLEGDSVGEVVQNVVSSLAIAFLKASHEAGNDINFLALGITIRGAEVGDTGESDVSVAGTTDAD